MRLLVQSPDDFEISFRSTTHDHRFARPDTYTADSVDIDRVRHHYHYTGTAAVLKDLLAHLFSLCCFASAILKDRVQHRCRLDGAQVHQFGGLQAATILARKHLPN